MDYLDKPDIQTFLAHHGIKGQRWGVRRFQNKDGSLTKAGVERYAEESSKTIKVNNDGSSTIPKDLYLTESAEPNLIRINLAGCMLVMEKPMHLVMLKISVRLPLGSC